MLLLLLSVSKQLREKCWLAYEILLYFLLQDFIDRVFFNIGEFNTNDIICISLIFIQLIIKIYVRLKK